MADGAIYLNWFGAGALATVTIPRPAVGIADLQFEPVTVAGVAETLVGKTEVQKIAGYDGVRLVISNFSAEGLRRDLEVVEEHLKAGYRLGLTLRTDRAWASFARSGVEPAREDLTLRTRGQLWSAYVSGAIVDTGDAIVVRSLGLGGQREVLTNLLELAPTGQDLTLNTSSPYRKVRFNHVDHAPVLVRHETFWPVLALDPSEFGKRLLTSIHGRVYTFNALLREDTEALSVLAEDDNTSILQGDEVTTGLFALDGLLSTLAQARGSRGRGVRQP